LDDKQALWKEQLKAHSAGRRATARETKEAADRQSVAEHGSMGFAGFYEKRSELTGTPAYAGTWLAHDRPGINRGPSPFGGMITGYVQARSQRRADQHMQAESQREQQGLQARVDLVDMLNASDTRRPKDGPSRGPGALPKGTQFNALLKPPGAPAASSKRPARASRKAKAK
jgi:hypothetical protein